jgi:hypothetical protein
MDASRIELQWPNGKSEIGPDGGSDRVALQRTDLNMSGISRIDGTQC